MEQTLHSQEEGQEKEKEAS